MRIGNFAKTPTGGFKGTVHFFSMTRELEIKSVEQKGEGPNFRAFIAGSDFDVGAGWVKKSKGGKSYVALQIDDPQFSAPITAALSRQADDYVLLWSRPKRRAAKSSSGPEQMTF